MWCTPRPVAAIYDEPIVVYSILVIVYGADAVETTTILDMHALLILSHISHPSMRLICKSGAFAPMVRPACVSSTYVCSRNIVRVRGCLQRGADQHMYIHSIVGYSRIRLICHGIYQCGVCTLLLAHRSPGSQVRALPAGHLQAFLFPFFFFLNFVFPYAWRAGDRRALNCRRNQPTNQPTNQSVSQCHRPSRR